MSRRILSAIAVALTIGGPVSAQDSSTEVIRIRDGVVSFGHDPDCPGCRAFLTGYSTSRTTHGPSCTCACQCDSAAGGGMGGDGIAADGGIGPDSGYDAPLVDDYQELVAGDFGAGRGYDTAAPGMIGDFFGGGYMIRTDEFNTFSQEPFNVPVAGGDRRYKIAENNSPFPVDRVFVNFNHFHNALRTANGKDAHLDRGVAGVEKTFFDAWWSVEFRLPFLSGLNGDQIINSATANNVSNEIGNVSLAFKRLLYSDSTLAASMGVGIVLPSGTDARIFSDPFDPTPEIVVENEAYYLQPFIGVWWTPNDQAFTQIAIQADIDARGNPVLVDDGGLTQQGVMQDQSLLFLDISFGYWLFHDPYSDAVITGIAPMLEFHHTTTLEDTDFVDFSGAVGGSFGENSMYNPYNRQDVLNMTAALRLELAGTSYLTFAGVVPLRTDEKLFDAEFSAQFTRFY